MKRKHIPFNVICENINKREFEAYDVMPYLISCYDEAKRKKTKPTTFDEFKKFVKDNSMYMYWARCQYEVVLQSWPCGNHDKKIDVHWQLMMNLDLVTRLLMENVGAVK